MPMLREESEKICRLNGLLPAVGEFVMSSPLSQKGSRFNIGSLLNRPPKRTLGIRVTATTAALVAEQR